MQPTYLLSHYSTYVGAIGSCCGRYSSGPNAQPVFRDYFYCRGNEKNLSECSKYIGSECHHNRDVFVICSKFTLLYNLKIISPTLAIFAESPHDDFQCASMLETTPSNVTELQFCDGISDCRDESDEPTYCPAGIQIYFKIAIKSFIFLTKNV